MARKISGNFRPSLELWDVHKNGPYKSPADSNTFIRPFSKSPGGLWMSRNGNILQPQPPPRVDPNKAAVESLEEQEVREARLVVKRIDHFRSDEKFFRAFVRQLFGDSDKNKDNYLQMKELDHCFTVTFSKVGLPPDKTSEEMFKKMVRKYDADKNGKLDQREFYKLIDDYLSALKKTAEKKLNVPSSEEQGSKSSSSSESAPSESSISGSYSGSS